jgi:hypothetical protein
MDLANVKKYLPTVAGAFFTFLTLQVADDAPTDSFYVLWLRETPFFLIGAIVGCSAQPKHLMIASLFVLVGVSLGVLLDVFVHPHDAHGHERNLFPIEIFFHTLLSVPGVFAVAATFGVVSFIRSNK